VYFDDGMKIEPGNQILTVVQKMLGGFNELSSTTEFTEEKWNCPTLTLPLSRINMPIKTKTGEGSASCGIGVILPIKDIANCGKIPHCFTWKFENMKVLRKQLMTLVLEWRNK
jgi:hypothetical protein